MAPSVDFVLWKRRTTQSVTVSQFTDVPLLMRFRWFETVFEFGHYFGWPAFNSWVHTEGCGDSCWMCLFDEV